MKIKRFYAETLRDALRQVKESLGADAVILSNNKTQTGVELVAAIDYDEKQVSRKVQPEKPEKTVIKQEESSNWLKELKKMQFAQPQTGEQAKEHKARLKLEPELKNDIVSFSQARQQKVVKKDPLISDDKVESLIDNSFSDLLQEKKARIVKQSLAASQQRGNTDAMTYSRPQVKKKPAKTSVRSRGSKKQVSEPKVQWSQDPMLVEMKAEIQSLKEMLQHQVSGLAWGSFNRNNPHRSELLQRLCKLGLKPSLCKTLIRHVDEEASLEESWKKSLSLISQGIRVAQEDILSQGGMVALVGSTGVGKTTSIAKLASRFTLRYGASAMALVSTDNYRVGAQEQLKTYGQLLRVPVYIVADEVELRQTLDRLRDKRLVLIDTAGMNQRDIRMTEQLAMLRRANKNIKLLSVLSAAAQSSAIYEVANTLRPFRMDGCIVTKMDESTSLGGILSVIMEQQLPLHYVTDGQKVPEDIHPGRASQLLKRAMAIVRERKDAYDYNDIALSFAGELLQANG